MKMLPARTVLKISNDERQEFFFPGLDKTGKRVFRAMGSDPKQINLKISQGNEVTYGPSKM